MESYRNTDMKAEKQLASFMDMYFYSKLHDLKGEPISFERIEERQKQLEGIDVVVHVNGKDIIIDEKASIYYSNAMIPTFAFEIDSIQKGHSLPVEGWFINNSLSTMYYMLIWPNIKCEKKEKVWIRKKLEYISSSDFTIVEAMLIEKKRLQEKIYELGFDREYLVHYAQKIRQKYGKSNDSFDDRIGTYLKIMYSGHLAEKPVNLVVGKELLKEVASAVYLISEDGYAKI